MKVFLLLVWLVYFAVGGGRHPRVAAVLSKHAATFAQTELMLTKAAFINLLQVPFAIPLRKQPKDGRNAAEKTLVPAGLGMAEAVQFALTLKDACL